MVLGLPGVGPRILGTAALPSLGRRSPVALAERTQVALVDARRLRVGLSRRTGRGATGPFAARLIAIGLRAFG
ncbi:hypothetical protein [Sorangium sp. So ce394]|uniref:hypothetical protein n=1 Tax=Sorangium sp. So ce394 TaxID=3133310 RepID=UPI003F5BABD9